MAIRERKERASPWECYWNNPFTGKRECAYFATKLEAEKMNSLIKHRLKFDRESFREENKEEKQDVVTLETAYLAYLREKQFNKKGLRWQMDAMRPLLRKCGKKDVAQVTYTDLVQIMDKMNEQPVKKTTVRNRMAVIRAVMRWCVDKGFREPLRFPKLPAADFTQFVPPSPREMAAIMASAPEHLRRVIIIGAQFGLRVGPCELFQLTWQDVDLIAGILRVKGSRKNRKHPLREIPIRDALLPILEKWKKVDEAAGMPWIIHFRGKPVSSIKTAWRRSLERAGITRTIRPYDLRHAFATQLIAAGADIGTVAKLMGHSSPTMILNHYQFVMDVQKKTAIESLPDLPICGRDHVASKKALTGHPASA